MQITRNSLKLFASPKAVIANFLSLPGSGRIAHVFERINKMPDEEIKLCLDKVMNDFGNRHRDIETIFQSHYNKVISQYEGQLQNPSANRKMLVGAYFTKEYSIQAAALFNPSIVLHFDQNNLKQGEYRFVMSLRATGEGHISSIVFKTGSIDHLMNIKLDIASQYSTCLGKNENALYSKEFVDQRMKVLPDYTTEFLQHFPDKFTKADARRIFDNGGLKQQESMSILFEQFNDILDSNYELESPTHLPLNEKVIFPNAKSECMGMEDVRFVKFEDNGLTRFYGTYTAYNGKQIKTQLIETADFKEFKIRTLYGNAITDKGMALFPEKVNGKYVMISRQDGERISIMYSEDLYLWNTHEVLMEPLYSWELLQLGNCGSPVKTDKGWLLLTHGVGAIRTYVISAVLLDLHNPSKIIGRLEKPLIQADETEREGYVPNVVYTCGLLRHGKMLVIPYAVSDSATAFITLELDELLKEMNLKY